MQAWLERIKITHFGAQVGLVWFGLDRRVGKVDFKCGVIMTLTLMMLMMLMMMMMMMADRRNSARQPRAKLIVKVE